jgi:hypothetical protein
MLLQRKVFQVFYLQMQLVSYFFFRNIFRFFFIWRINDFFFVFKFNFKFILFRPSVNLTSSNAFTKTHGS